MAILEDRAPGKVVAVHLSYRSRAAERGRTPPFPSYFLKPPTSVARSGQCVIRPDGCELLAFEGEVALIIGTRAKRVPMEQAWSHVAWVTAANDFGVYDLRYADLGSNVRSKGADGFTPLGPQLLDAATIDPARLHLRTWVNGVVVQDARVGDELIFGFDRIVADLSRLMTLEPGDVILTGTPAGSGVVAPGDTVEVEVWDGSADGPADGRTSGRLVSPIVQDETPMAPIGAMPKVDDETRRLARGGPREPRDTGTATSAVDAELLRLLKGVSTATISSQLRKRGLHSCTLDGLRATRPELKMIGFAKTLEYLPLREDLFAEFGGGYNAQKRVVDEIAPGEVLVIGARGQSNAGTIGDILALRAQLRGAAGIVTDGALRDYHAIAAMELPVYTGGAHPAVLGRRHVPWQCDVAVSCGETLVCPGDLIVGDGDGVVVVPRSVASEVARDAVEQEREERFILERVAAGDAVQGLYPLTKKWRPVYEAWSARTEQS
ncbi:fumarylacetoacetate hydrolase family protein [Dactylosporangium sp. CA-092794]|uniref:fumarylacetoacetate hydrolase family protein n=1 Tax=Dactylosporangium sp. CA-092794 TaxID=3239929 RepID=UPI003D94E700